MTFLEEPYTYTTPKHQPHKNIDRARLEWREGPASIYIYIKNIYIYIINIYIYIYIYMLI